MNNNKLIASFGLLSMILGLTVGFAGNSSPNQVAISQNDHINISFHRGSGRRGSPENQNKPNYVNPVNKINC